MSKILATAIFSLKLKSYHPSIQQCPGIRVGWMVASKKNIELLSNYSSFGMGGVSHPSQLYAVALMEKVRLKQARKAIELHYNWQVNHLCTSRRKAAGGISNPSPNPDANAVTLTQSLTLTLTLTLNLILTRTLTPTRTLLRLTVVFCFCHFWFVLLGVRVIYFVSEALTLT